MYRKTIKYKNLIENSFKIENSHIIRALPIFSHYRCCTTMYFIFLNMEFCYKNVKKVLYG